MSAAKKPDRTHVATLDPAGFLRMIRRGLRNMATLGAYRRRQRQLPLVPGQVVVGWIGDDADQAMADDFIRRSTSRWSAGAGRATDVLRLRAVRGRDYRDKNSDRPAYSNPRMRTWILYCRAGTEADLADALNTQAARWHRQHTTPWKRDTFMVSRVPWMRIQSPTAGYGNITLAERFSQACHEIGVDRMWSGDTTVVVGILDVGADQEALRDAGFTRVVVDTWQEGAVGQAPHKVVGVAPPTTQWHGTAVAGMIATVATNATVKVLDVRQSDQDPIRSDDQAASWILIALYKLKHVDLLNLSVSVDKGGMQAAATFELICSQALEDFAQSTCTVVVAAAGNAAEGIHRAERMALPARDQHVVAVGSMTETGQPWDRNRAGGKQGDLHWLMPGGTRHSPIAWRCNDAENPTTLPVYGTSFATALFTAFLARRLTQMGRFGSPAELREQTLRLAESYTVQRPVDGDPAVWGRGHLRADNAQD